MKKDSLKTNQSNNKFSLTPLGERVLIKEDKESKEKKTASGIIIPVTVNEDKGSKRGKVVGCGEGKYEDGKIIPMRVKVGDDVLFQWGDKISLDGEEYYIVRESEILAIIN